MNEESETDEQKRSKPKSPEEMSQDEMVNLYKKMIESAPNDEIKLQLEGYLSEIVNK